MADFTSHPPDIVYCNQFIVGTASSTILNMSGSARQLILYPDPNNGNRTIFMGNARHQTIGLPLATIVQFETNNPNIFYFICPTGTATLNWLIIGH